MALNIIYNSNIRINNVAGIIQQGDFVKIRESHDDYDGCKYVIYYIEELQNNCGKFKCYSTIFNNFFISGDTLYTTLTKIFEPLEVGDTLKDTLKNPYEKDHIMTAISIRPLKFSSNLHEGSASVENVDHFLRNNYLIRGGKKLDVSKYPNVCTQCNSPAYVGFSSIECSNTNCKHYRESVYG